MAPGAPVQRINPAVEQALCEGRATDAARILTSEPLSSPADRFYTGLALEESGRPVAARRIYASLMTSGAQDGVFAHCGSMVLADGPVSAEAGRRLAIIASKLQTMDVARGEPLQFGVGLPPTQNKPSDVSRTAPAAGNGVGPRRAVTRPSGNSPLGRWFAHLASYRSYDHAMSGKSSLEKQYPALTDIIDQWEVNVGGYALRLGVRLSDKSDAKELCAQVKSQGEYCAVMDTSQ
ncbi:hypothetical protein [Kordiimonas aestuarii]|uniref:hypothetical protein n=1 Tax=Kordiimonas aestuarii TaxID=1005925 RepID=UPI0021CE10D4|nr:hypothetical protein [Kordiimonas aestuarii]